MSVKQVSDYLDANFTNDAYIKHRSTLIDLFKFAIARGLADQNVAAQTLAKSTKARQTKLRRRLTMDGYNSIYQQAPQWLKNAMDIALITLQSRNEVCNMRFDDINQDEG